MFLKTKDAKKENSHNVVQMNPEEDKYYFSHHILHLCNH